MKTFKINAKKCAGCRLCEMACSFKHHTEFSPGLSNILIHCIEDMADCTPLNCIQCENRYCVKACRFDALSIDEKTGAVIVDQEKCKKCKLCIKACVHKGVRLIKKDNKPQISICDLCGGDPECVKVCREQAIAYVEAE